MFDGDSPPQWSLEELRERYNPQSPLGSDDEPDEPDDPSLSPESVMGHRCLLPVTPPICWNMIHPTPLLLLRGRPHPRALVVTEPYQGDVLNQ